MQCRENNIKAKKISHMECNKQILLVFFFAGWMLLQGGKVEMRLLPYNRRVALTDGDVVGGPLHIHTPDGESCRDKTEQSEKRSLQLLPTRFAPHMHLKKRLGSNRS